MTPAPTAILPDGFTVRLAPDTRVLEQGFTILGGSPMRLMRLTPVAQKLLSKRELVVRDAASRTLVNLLIDANLALPLLNRRGDATGPAKQLTYVIPVFGRADELDRLLQCIDQRSAVLVVDDGSPDPDLIAAVAKRHKARVIRLAQNHGPARARNEGLAQVTTPFVAFIDSDVVLDPQTLESLTQHFDDPALAAVAPRIEGLTEANEGTWIERYEASESSLDMGPNGGLVRPQTELGWVPSAALVARVTALRASFGNSQPFDERMRVGEDVNLVWALIEQGWRVRYDPTFSVYHEHRQTVASWLSRKAVYGSSAAALAQRHPNNLATAILTPWSVVFVMGLLIQRKWSLAASLVALGWAWQSIYRTVKSGSRPTQLTSRLTLYGAFTALRQTSALLLRHWWPLSVALSFFSKRARRALAAATLFDVALAYRRKRPRLNLFSFALARRLDDAAYGAGLWNGAWRARSTRALLLRVSRRR